MSVISRIYQGLLPKKCRNTRYGRRMAQHLPVKLPPGSKTLQEGTSVGDYLVIILLCPIALSTPPGCDATIITALGLRRARPGTIPLYRSTLVCTTLTYDCSPLHALAVTTTTLEPAEADRSERQRGVALVKRTRESKAAEPAERQAGAQIHHDFTTGRPSAPQR